MHNLKEPSFFRTNTTGVAYGLLLFVITPHFNKSWTNLSILFYDDGGICMV
jgi:hypothetical protein